MADSDEVMGEPTKRNPTWHERVAANQLAIDYFGTASPEDVAHVEKVLIAERERILAPFRELAEEWKMNACLQFIGSGRAFYLTAEQLLRDAIQKAEGSGDD